MRIGWLSGTILWVGFAMVGCAVDTPGPEPVAMAEESVAARATPAPTLAPAPTPTAAPTPTSVPPTPTPTPTAAPPPTPGPVPTPTAAPTPTPGPVGACGTGPIASPDPDRPRYRAELDIDPSTGEVVGSVTVELTPDEPIDKLVVRLWANSPRQAALGTAMTLLSATVDGEPTQFSSVDPTLVEVPLSQPVTVGETVTTTLDFELVVANSGKSRFSRRSDYMRLGSVLPVLPWETGYGWASDPPTSLFAEATSSPTADYTVTVEVPEGFDVLASGQVDANGAWTATAARDFAVSVGRFRTVTGTANAPDQVAVTVGIHETEPGDENAYLAKVIDSLERFSARFGPYPWPTLSLAITPDLGGGIEYPTHIMQGPSTIGRTTSHEIAHMFFYSLVGNNQGTDPWLDEGLASYAEFTYEDQAPFEIALGATGRATEPMSYWETNRDLYYQAVYAQPGFALQALGDQAEVDCALARYVATNAYRIARPSDLVSAFEGRFPDVVARLAELGVELPQEPVD